MRLVYPFGVVEVTKFDFTRSSTYSTLSIIYNTTPIHIQISAANLRRAFGMRRRYLDILRRAEPGELDDVAARELFDMALKGCAQRLSSQYRDPRTYHEPNLLHYAYLLAYAQHHELHATEDNQLQLEYCDTAKFEKTKVLGTHSSAILGARVSAYVAKELCPLWPTYQPTQVGFCVEDSLPLFSKPPRKVLVDGSHVWYFKPYFLHDDLVANQEIERYTKIKEKNLDNPGQIRQLEGLVGDNKGTVFGLLLSYIDSKIGTLKRALKTNPPEHLRLKWATQITEAMRKLHSAGALWESVKSENVLIDDHNDAWIVNLVSTPMLVYRKQEFAAKVQQDEHDLLQMVNFINNPTRGNQSSRLK